MKHTLISAEKAVAAIEKIQDTAATERERELLREAVCAVMNMEPLFPEAECTSISRWRMRSDEGQGVTWYECSACDTVGSPKWKRCPVCEAKMKIKRGVGDEKEKHPARTAG